MKRHQELLDLIESFRADFEKFYTKGNKTAGIRVRKHMQELKKMAQSIRDEVQDVKEQEETTAS
jgi:hypothetical protein